MALNASNNFTENRGGIFIGHRLKLMPKAAHLIGPLFSDVDHIL